MILLVRAIDLTSRRFRRVPKLRLTLVCMGFVFAISLFGSSVSAVSSTWGATTYPLGQGTVPRQFLVEPAAGVRPMTRALNRAQHSIMVEDYILTDARIVHALERASAQGVSVYVILEPHPLGMGLQPVTVAAQLRAAGCYLQWARGFYLTHAKLLIVDDRLAIVSTANLSRSGFSRNREFLVFDRNPVDVRQLSSIFRTDWDHRPATLKDVNVVVSPINARSSLTALITSSRHSIDIYAEEVTDSRIAIQLAQKERAGVRVRVLIPASAASRALALLGSARAVVRVLANPYAHAKAIVIDKSRAFVGSENLSATSLDLNREYGLILRGSVISRIEQTFDQDWRGAKASS